MHREGVFLPGWNPFSTVLNNKGTLSFEEMYPKRSPIGFGEAVRLFRWNSSVLLLRGVLFRGPRFGARDWAWVFRGKCDVFFCGLDF